jgi:rod shape determining protein RodA
VIRLAALLPPGDRRVLVVYALLLMTSLAILWSVTEPLRGPYNLTDADVSKGVFWRQVLWIGVSWCAMAVAARLPLRHVANLAWPAYFGTVLLLVVVLVAAPEVSGARRWLPFGPLRLQPSEFGKLACIVLLASYLSRRSNPRSPALTAGTALALILVPMILVMREPDLGTSLAYLCIWLGMVFWYGISGSFLLTAGSVVASAVIMFYSESVAAIAWPWGIYLLLLMAVLYLSRLSMLTSVLVLLLNLVSGLGIPLIWGRFEPYQQSRILTFFDPSRDATGTGYQAIQSRVAIGSGGLFGTHYLKGTQKGLAFLPERHTDFIFSVVGEELGLVGALVVLALFLVLILQAVEIALAVRRPFTSLMAVGIASYFAFHIVVNVSITTGLMPVTGLPLPLVSYGGSNILVSSLMVGLLLNISGRQYDA